MLRYPVPVFPGAAPRRRRRWAALMLALTGASIGAALLVSGLTVCYVVTAGGESVAYVQGAATCRAAVRQVERQVSAILEEDYAYPDGMQIARTIAPREEVMDTEELSDALMGTVPQVQPAWVVTVEGEGVAVCRSRAEGEQALGLLKDRYTTEDTVAVSLTAAVDLVPQYVPADAALLAPEALARLLATGTAEEAWPVLAGGEAPQPLVGVCTVEEVTYTAAVPPPVEERPDDGLLLGQRATLYEGVAGREERTDRVTRRNGAETDRQTLSVTPRTEPVAAVVAVGTAEGVEGARGRFIWPCAGQITSPFGARHIFGTDGTHTGLDIADRQGAAIAAAADGTVCFAGPCGTYGQLVKVDHGNGFVTYYAHCSALLVSVGDWVAQGETIAEMGSTGRSTGPHCHFEIRWLGTPLDPLACLG